MKTIDAVKMQRIEHTRGVTVGFMIIGLWVAWLA